MVIFKFNSILRTFSNVQIWLTCAFVVVYRWLAKDEDDGLIVRELPLGGTSLLNSMSIHNFHLCPAFSELIQSLEPREGYYLSGRLVTRLR